MVRVAAHLIVGAREEPFLGPLLRSIESFCDVLVVNDNAAEPSPHTETLRESAFGQRGSLFVDRSRFVDFSTARNRCLAIHAQHGAGDWVAFIDADEVHDAAAARIASRLHLVPSEIGAIDGYTWHFFQSFDWYRSIERRMAFFRYSPDLQWEGSVHEQLRGLSEKRLAVPYVYAHYGWVLPVRRQAEKGRQYFSLGAPGAIVAEDQLDAIDRRHYFRKWWATALRFRGAHPETAVPVIRRLREEFAEEFTLTDRYIREHQTASDRLRNAVAQLNYEQRWRSRALNAFARRLVW